MIFTDLCPSPHFLNISDKIAEFVTEAHMLRKERKKNNHSVRTIALFAMEEHLMFRQNNQILNEV